MAVVTQKSPNAQNNVDPAKAKGRMFVAADTITNAATDNTGSKYLIGLFPSECILDSKTYFNVTNWGYADIRIGTFSDPAALVSQTKATSNNISPIAQGDARHAKPLWQQLGMAADPGGEIGLWAHGSVANAVAAGSMLAEIHYRHR